MLVLCSAKIIPKGAVINACIITIVATMISLSRYFNTIEEIGYRKKLVLQADHRTKERQRIRQLEEQQSALLHHSQDLLFLWDKTTDIILLSGDKILCEEDKKTLINWLQTDPHPKDTILPLSITPIQTPTGAIGHLTPQ